MAGISLAGLSEFAERVGIPALLALVCLWFLVSYLRTERSRATEPEWMMGIRREISLMHRAHREHSEQMRKVESIAQECRTMLRMRSGMKGGD